MDIKAIRKAMGLRGEASPEQMRKALEAAFLYAEAMKGEEPEMMPEEKPEEPAKDEPKAEEEKPADEGEKKDEAKAASVKLADEPPPPAEEKPADEAAPAPEAEKADEKIEALTLLSQILGLEAPAALAWLRDNAEGLKQFAASGSQAPMLGDSGEEFQNKAATARITALRAELDTAKADTGKALAAKDAEIAALAAKLNEGEVDALIREGKILDSERALAVKMAQKDHSLFVEWYASKSTKVPTGAIAASTPTPPPVDMHGTGAEDELRSAMDRNLQHVIKDPAKRRELVDSELRKFSDKSSNGRA